MTYKDLAHLVMCIYDRAHVDWDYLTPPDNQVVWGAKRIDGVTAIVHRGSITWMDWILDFIACPTHPTIDHSVLGPVHAGFFAGMPECWEEIKRRTQPPWVLGAHSLGAGRQGVLAGLMMADGVRPAARVAWGEPLSGCNELVRLCVSIPTASYRNGEGWVHDPVPSVPLWLPQYPYLRASKLTEVTVKPGNWFNPTHWHDMGLYEQGTPNTVIRADAV